MMDFNILESFYDFAILEVGGKATLGVSVWVGLGTDCVLRRRTCCINSGVHYLLPFSKLIIFFFRETVVLTPCSWPVKLPSGSLSLQKHACVVSRINKECVST